MKKKNSLAEAFGEDMPEDDAEEAPPEDDGMVDAGQALLDAIKSGDAQGVADAVANLVALAGSE